MTHQGDASLAAWRFRVSPSATLPCLCSVETEAPQKTLLDKRSCVPGIPITEYCDQNRLTNRERLELFLPQSQRGRACCIGNKGNFCGNIGVGVCRPVHPVLEDGPLGSGVDA